MTTFPHFQSCSSFLFHSLKPTESFLRPPPTLQSPSLAINVRILGFNSAIAFLLVREFIHEQNWLDCWSCWFSSNCCLYVSVAILKWTLLHLSICIFPLWKSWNGTVGLEKQTKMIVCNCIMLLVWRGFRVFLLPDGSWLAKSGPPSQI